MSSFRQYGGLNRAPTNNIVRNHYSNSDNPTISNFLGLYNSKIVSESHLDLSGNSILNINGIYFDNGTTIIDGSFNGDLTVNGNLEVTKNTKLDGSLNVFGDATFNSTVIIDGSLNVAGTTTSLYFVSGSDYRIKTDVKPIDAAFVIDQLNPVTYINKISGKQDTGFIAHEVQEIFPHLVTGIKDGEETQTLNYQGLIAILTKEIQELKKRVEILETK
jgi:cytoskeletal protein CcmA (bactofilin family)